LLEKKKLVRHGFHPDRAFHSYNPLPAIPSGKPRIKSPDFVMGSLTRLSRDRSVDEAIRTLKTLVDRRIDARLVIGGVGPEREPLESLVNELGLHERVQFLEHVNDLSAFFSNIDMLVNSIMLRGDDGAGVGNNILEASMFYMPVVTYDSLGLREMVIDGSTGYCVPIGNRELFVERILQLNASPALRERLGLALFSHVQAECSDEKIYKETFSVYQRASGIAE